MRGLSFTNSLEVLVIPEFPGAGAAVGNQELWALRCSPLPANHPKPTEGSRKSGEKVVFFLSKEQSWWLHHQQQDSCCFVHKNPRWRTCPSSIPFGFILILLMFVKQEAVVQWLPSETRCFSLFPARNIPNIVGIQPALPSETGHFFLFLGIFPVSWECSLYSPLKQGILFIPNILGMQSAFFRIPSQEYSQYPGNAAYPPRQHISIPRKAALLSWSPRRLHFIASHCISLHFIAFHLQECWE